MEKDLPPLAPADSFFRHTPQPICWLDGDGRLAATTKVFDDLFPAAPPGTPFAAVAEAWQPQPGDPAWDDFWARVGRGEEGTLRVEKRRAGQPPAVFQVRGVAHRREEGTFTCLLFSDATSQVLAAQETARLVERFRSIVQEFPVMIYGLDAAYRVVVWNEKCERVTGYAYGEIAGDPRALDRLYPDPAAVRATLDQLPGDGTYAGHEAPPVTHRFRDDRRCVVSWRYRPNRSPLVEVSTWAIGIDLTAAYEANHALAQNEERFRAISQATNDVLWDWDMQTDMIWWGSGMSHLFGHGLSQKVSHVNWWVEHVHPDDRERVLNRIREHIDRREAFWLDEYRFRRGDDSYASVFDKGRIMHDDQGRPFRMVGGIRDMTDLKIALEKVQLRDRQLAEVSFYNSHKVRAPLARLLGLVHVLRLDPDTPPAEQGELLEKIRNAAEELDYLVKNINQLLH